MTGAGWTSLLLLGVLTGCGSGPSEGSAGDSASDSEGGSTAQGSTTAQQPTTGVSDSMEPTTGGASQSSQSGSSSSGEPTTDATTSVSGTSSEVTTDSTTMDVSASASATTTGEEGTTTADPSAADTTTGTDETTGTTGGGESSTGVDCVPSPEICNDLDDDCDDLIDNVDVGKDGICDCLNIALIGNQGSNPSSQFQTWLEDQGTEVVRISTIPNEVLDKAALNDKDIIILDYLIRSYTPDEQAAVQTWVEAGGGLMAMTGFTNVQFVADRPNSLTGPMGLGYNTSKGFFGGPVTNFAPHEITKDLTSISFYGGLFIDIVEDGVGVNKTIMTLPQGPVGVVQDRGAGRLFLFGDEWIEFDSEWQQIPQIQQFWVQTLSFLGPKTSCQVPQ